MRLRFTADVQCSAGDLRLPEHHGSDAERATLSEWAADCRARHKHGTDSPWLDGCTVEVSPGGAAMFGGSGFDSTVLAVSDPDWLLLAGRAVCPDCVAAGLACGALKTEDPR